MCRRLTHCSSRDVSVFGRLERLQRLAEKVHHDCRSAEDQLDAIEAKIKDVSVSIQRQ